jgi:hypothetical protein
MEVGMAHASRFIFDEYLPRMRRWHWHIFDHQGCAELSNDSGLHHLTHELPPTGNETPVNLKLRREPTMRGIAERPRLVHNAKHSKSRPDIVAKVNLFRSADNSEAARRLRQS